MRIAFTIAILLLALIGAKSQDFYVSPAYYPVEVEIGPEWRPSEASGFVLSPVVKNESLSLSWWERHKKGVIVAVVQFGAVTLDAVGDAVYDMGKESHNSSQMFWGHTLQATAITGATTSLVSLSWDGNIWDGVKFGVGYVAMRYALFDLAYNITRGIDPLYADGLKAEMPPDGRAFTQTIVFAFSVSFSIKEF